MEEKFSYMSSSTLVWCWIIILSMEQKSVVFFSYLYSCSYSCLCLYVIIMYTVQCTREKKAKFVFT
jgi:hypothetical protein